MSQKGLYRKYVVKENWYWFYWGFNGKPKKNTRRFIKKTSRNKFLRDIKKASLN